MAVKPKTKRHVRTDLTVPKGEPLVTFGELVGYLRDAATEFSDPRTGASIRYELDDVALGTFGTFYIQSASFLAYQQAMEEKYGLSNAQTLFGIRNIPSDTHIRTLMDVQSPVSFAPVFTACLGALKRTGLLGAYAVPISPSSATLLCALDGVQYFGSDHVHCNNCTVKTHTQDGKTTVGYSHTMVTPTLVAPGSNIVISLLPEFITPQDGADKQDCELNASKRWLDRSVVPALEGETMTILGDDLYAHEPFCREVHAAGHHFIFVAKPGTHKALYEAAEQPGVTKRVVATEPTDTGFVTRTYDYAVRLPLRAGARALSVNFVEMTEVTTRTTLRGQPLDTPRVTQTYHNAFVSDHELNPQTVALVAAAGRARWKVENENNNTLKTKGYHLEHNYGHGKNQLAAVLATMNILAFLFHTILDLGNLQYQCLRALLTRARLFDHVKINLIYHCYTSMESLLTWMAKEILYPHAPPPAGVPIER